jgi:hypothetical protein
MDSFSIARSASDLFLWVENSTPSPSINICTGNLQRPVSRYGAMQTRQDGAEPQATRNSLFDSISIRKPTSGQEREAFLPDTGEAADVPRRQRGEISDGALRKHPHSGGSLVHLGSQASAASPVRISGASSRPMSISSMRARSSPMAPERLTPLTRAWSSPEANHPCVSQIGIC